MSLTASKERRTSNKKEGIARPAHRIVPSQDHHTRRPSPKVRKYVGGGDVDCPIGKRRSTQTSSWELSFKNRGGDKGHSVGKNHGSAWGEVARTDIGPL